MDLRRGISDTRPGKEEPKGPLQEENRTVKRTDPAQQSGLRERQSKIGCTRDKEEESKEIHTREIKDISKS